MLQTFYALKAAIPPVLDTLKNTLEHSDKVYEVEIARLEDAVNVFEIMGPKSSQVIQGALTPVKDSREEFKKVLKGVLGCYSFPLIYLQFCHP